MTAPALRALAAVALTTTLAGCYVIPATPEQMAWFYGQAPAPGAAPSGAPPVALQPLSARLYPENAQASQVGFLTGTIATAATGKGRFTLIYKGEPLSGEATRLGPDSPAGVAAAYGPTGTFMNCEYQMRSPRSGAGTCAVSDGARFQVHVGE